MLDFFSQFADAVVAGLKFLWSTVQSMLSFFQLLPQWQEYMYGTMAILPPLVLPFISLGLALSIVFILLKVLL